MSNSVFLKACAHCAGMPALRQWRDTVNPNATWIECVQCGLMTDTFYDPNALIAQHKAAERWNTRVLSTAMYMVKANGTAELVPLEVVK